MKKTSILKRFYGNDQTKSTLQSLEAIDRAIFYHEEVMKKYIGKRFPGSLKRVSQAIRHLSKDLIEPTEIFYKDFREMVQCIITKIFEYLNNHPSEKDINEAVKRYGSDELISLKQKFDQLSLRMRKISNDLSETLDDQYLCLSQIKTATERAKKINEGIKR
jgi:predicted phosphatase